MHAPCPEKADGKRCVYPKGFRKPKDEVKSQYIMRKDSRERNKVRDKPIQGESSATLPLPD